MADAAEQARIAAWQRQLAEDNSDEDDPGYHAGETGGDGMDFSVNQAMSVRLAQIRC
jgi:hypothetical protein